MNKYASQYGNFTLIFLGIAGEEFQCIGAILISNIF